MKEELGNEKREGSILVPFVVGGLIGAGVALLLAPKAGRELRKDIKDIADNTRENVVSTIDRGRELYAESRAAIKNAVDAGKTAYVAESEKHRQAA